jgi:hypothetical protein
LDGQLHEPQALLEHHGVAAGGGVQGLGGAA